MIEISGPVLSDGLDVPQGAALSDPSVVLAAEIPALPAPIVPVHPGLLKWITRACVLLLVAGLLFYALQRAPLPEIGRVLSGLHPVQIGLLLAVDFLIYALISARWWLVVRSEKPGVRYLPMIAVRVSVFAVSYLTFGPQIGGEPLQVLYLRRKYGISFTRAAASVVMDKLFELFGNFMLLAFGLLAFFRSGLLFGTSPSSRLMLLLVGLLISWPLIHILLLYRRIYPLSAVLHALGPRSARNTAMRFVRAAERLAGQFCQRHPRAMLQGLFVSVLAALATVGEYGLITLFLDLRLPFWKLITAWTTGWLSFLVPVPGGLGALEASQVSVLGLFGVSAAAAISVTLIMRGRDLLIGGLGLLMVGNAARRD